MNYENYREKFSERLWKLSNAYVLKKKDEIKVLNLEIDKKNAENKAKWKTSFIHTGKFKPDSHLPTYSISKMLSDINEKYACTLLYQNYNLYTKGDAFPDAKVIKILSDFFQVSFEYMNGFTDIPNELNCTIQELIHLSSDAINTLISYNENPTVLSVINGLLSDKESSTFLFMNMYEQIYKTYKLKQSKGKLGEYEIEILQKQFLYTESFTKYLNDHLLPIVIKEFEQRLITENNDVDWRSQNYDEYEAVMKNAINESDESTLTIKNVYLTQRTD